MAKHPVTALTLAVCFLLCPFGANGDIADIVRKHDHGTREERARADATPWHRGGLCRGQCGA